MERAAECWRGLGFTEFELRQIASARKDLDAEYEAAITPPARSSQPGVSSKSGPDLSGRYAEQPHRSVRSAAVAFCGELAAGRRLSR
jgi:hypothetical protein